MRKMPLRKTCTAMAYRRQNGDVEGVNESRWTTRYRLEGCEGECENECEAASFGPAEKCDKMKMLSKDGGTWIRSANAEIFSAMSAWLAGLRVLAATAAVVVSFLVVFDGDGRCR